MSLTLPAAPARRADIAVIALMALLVLPFVWTSATSADEFTTLSHGLRLAGGQVIYRDFFEFAAPLSRWLAGGIFLVTGPSLLAARLVQGALLVLAGWQLFRLGRALGAGRLVAGLLGPAMLLGHYRVLPGFSHHWVALPLVLGALQAAFAGERTSRTRWWGLSGALVGLCLLTMQSDGVALVAALATWLGVDAWLGRRPPGDLARRAGLFALGFALPLLLAGLYLASQQAFADALYHMFVWPLSHYKTPGGINDVKFLTDLAVIATTHVGWVNLPFWYMRTGFFLALLALMPLTALAVVAWGLGQVGLRLAGGPAWRPDQARLALLGAIACAFFLTAVRGRADGIHIAAYAVPALLTVAALSARWRSRFTGSTLAWLPQLGLGLYVLAGAGLTLQTMREQPAQWLSLTSPDARLAESPALVYLRAQARPGDRLVAFPYGGLFYIYGLPPATRYSVIHAPSDGYNTPEEFADFWQSALAARPRFLVFAPYRPLAASRAAYLPDVPAGYRLAGTWPSPIYPGQQVEVYERAAP